jgi:hypothetical protein
MTRVKALFQQESVGEELASPTDVAQRLIAAPDRIGSADSADDPRRPARGISCFSISFILSAALR